MDSIEDELNIDRLNDLKVNNEGFAFDSRTGNTYTINATGLHVMKGIRAGAANSHIISEIAERFDVDPLTAARDVERFFDQLARHNIIKVEASV